jgi:hypothetical protein
MSDFDENSFDEIIDFDLNISEQEDDDDSTFKSVDSNSDFEFDTDVNEISLQQQKDDLQMIFVEKKDYLRIMSEYEITYLLQCRTTMLQKQLFYNKKKIDPYLCYLEGDETEYNIARIELYFKIIPFKLIRHLYDNLHHICCVQELNINHSFYLNENEINALKK